MIGQGDLQPAHLQFDIAEVLPREVHPWRRLGGLMCGGESGVGSVQVTVGVREAEITPGALALGA